MDIADHYIDDLCTKILHREKVSIKPCLIVNFKMKPDDVTYWCQRIYAAIEDHRSPDHVLHVFVNKVRHFLFEYTQRQIVTSLSQE